MCVLLINTLQDYNLYSYLLNLALQKLSDEYIIKNLILKLVKTDVVYVGHQF